MTLSEMIDQMTEAQRERLRLRAIEIRDEDDDRNVLRFFAEDVNLGELLEIQKRARHRLTEEAERILAERPAPEPSYEAWRPEVGACYWVPGRCAYATMHVWDGGHFDWGVFAAGNVFPTRETAERAARETAAWRRLKGLARMMNAHRIKHGLDTMRPGAAVIVLNGYGTMWSPSERIGLGEAAFRCIADARRAIDILHAEGHLDYLRPEGAR